MNALPDPREDEASEAFYRYSEAKKRADMTLDFRDAMAAGRAWREFLNLFLSLDQQMPVDTNIIEFPKGGRR